jgi:hypothetical protein
LFSTYGFNAGIKESFSAVSFVWIEANTPTRLERIFIKLTHKSVSILTLSQSLPFGILLLEVVI